MCRVVDPRHGGQLGRLGLPVAEAGWVRGVRGREGLGSRDAHLGGGAVMDRGWGVEPDPGMAPFLMGRR